MTKVPRLNSKVWIIVFIEGEVYTLSKQKVYMKNKEGFITEETIDDSIMNEARIEYTLDSYGENWFKTFKEAKEYLDKYYEGYATYTLEKNKTLKDFYYVETEDIEENYSY